MNNQEILQYLKYQEKKVEGQLEALRLAINTIEGAFSGEIQNLNSSHNTTPSEKPVAASMTAPVGEPDNKAEAPKAAKYKGPFVDKWEVKPSNDSKGKGTRPVKLGKNYQDNKSYTKKIAYLLLKEGERSTVELIERIKDLEPGEPDTKVERSVAIGTSSMFRKGLINAKKDGRRYIYSLKDKSEL